MVKKESMSSSRHGPRVRRGVTRTGGIAVHLFIDPVSPKGEVFWGAPVVGCTKRRKLVNQNAQSCRQPSTLVYSRVAGGVPLFRFDLKPHVRGTGSPLGMQMPATWAGESVARSPLVARAIVVAPVMCLGSPNQGHGPSVGTDCGQLERT